LRPPQIEDRLAGDSLDRASMIGTNAEQVVAPPHERLRIVRAAGGCAAY